MNVPIPDDYEDFKDQATELANDFIDAINKAQIPLGVVLTSLSYVSADIVCRSEAFEKIPEHAQVFLKMFRNRIVTNIDNILAVKDDAAGED